MKPGRAIPMLLLLLAQAPTEQITRDPTFDPLHAEKSIEIGQYYMKKGNYDAAIERFQDAAGYKPNFALPYRLMGEAYEKKGEKAQAVKSYQKYLEILPSAEDGGKVRKRIAELSRELKRAARRRSG
jgi:tetratricopeptide (TPR) repeat protein